MLLMFVFLAAWFGLFAETLGWMGRALFFRAKGTFFADLILLFFALGLPRLLGWGQKRARDGDGTGDDGGSELVHCLRRGPENQPKALLVALVLAALAVGADRFLAVHTLTAMLFALGTYTLSRLYLPPSLWRRGLPLFLLLLLLLPAQDQLDAFIAFPLRINTAEIVSELLSLLHVRSTSAEAILVLENGIAHVDLPCSGMKGLTVGALFYLCATWLLRRRLDARWALGGALLSLFLFCTNTMRVFVLIFLYFTARQQKAAEVLHVPLGALGFLLSCTLALLFLQRYGNGQEEPAAVPAAGAEEPVERLPQRTLLLSMLVLLCLAFLRPPPQDLPRTAAGLGASSHFGPPPLPFFLDELSRPPYALTFSELPLTADEEALFFGHGGVLAKKWRFFRPGPHQPLAGSLLLVVSRSFRAHHPPEVCLAAAGLKVDAMRPLRIGAAGDPAQQAGFAARKLSIDDGQRAAFYWFQSPDLTTDSLLQRTLAELSLQRRRRQAPWALTAVLFDGPTDERAGAVPELLFGLHRVVGAYLKGAEK